MKTIESRLKRCSPEALPVNDQYVNNKMEKKGSSIQNWDDT